MEGVRIAVKMRDSKEKTQSGRGIMPGLVALVIVVKQLSQFAEFFKRCVSTGLKFYVKGTCFSSVHSHKFKIV